LLSRLLFEKTARHPPIFFLLASKNFVGKWFDLFAEKVKKTAFASMF